MTQVKTRQTSAGMPVARAPNAGRTNKVRGSLVKCEVSLDSGDWISPDSCAVFKIDPTATFPEIVFSLKTDSGGPFHWSWELKWVVQACPQRRDRSRFKPKRPKAYVEKGKFVSQSAEWACDLNGKVIGGDLVVKVQTRASSYMRKVRIDATEPGRERIIEELDKYVAAFPDEARLAKKIFEQESRYHHLFSDEQPLVSFDNGYGLGQATTPEPSFEQVWNWKKHVEYVVTRVIAEKRRLARSYLDKHGSYTAEDLDAETLVYYNGANYHYLVWDKGEKRWNVNSGVLCDPDQSNTGWNMKAGANKGLTLDELRKGKGEKPVYTGRCYAEHIKNANNGFK